MREFDYIRWLRGRTPADPRVPVGPGDDCAVLASAPGNWLATTDMLLEGTHFDLAEATPRRVGRKALAVNLSDIAAMAGRPVACLVSVGLPGSTSDLAEQLYVGIRELADAFGVAIVGGDTNASAAGLVVCITLLGQVQQPGPVLRSGARPGDRVLVTGPLGGSILGHHLDFTPRVHEAKLLHQLVPLHAMIDISDGLAADLSHICEESGCGATIDADRVPISAAAQRLADSRSPLQHALSDGEDFELLFTVGAEDSRMLLERQPIPGVRLYDLGVCHAEPGLFLERQGSKTLLPPDGYEHHF